jgi:DNA-binding NtrC family response regulator
MTETKLRAETTETKLIVYIDCRDAEISEALAAGARSTSAVAMVRSDSSGAWPETDRFLLLTDGPVASLTQFAADMRASGRDPNRSIVRILCDLQTEWTYHDLPAFASISAPRDADAAAAAIQRLCRARQQTSVAPAGLPKQSGADEHGGPSAARMEQTRLARLAAQSDLKVLLTGETGTGKNTLAKQIHAWSGRAGPFVSINCAELPDALIESELFGVEPGAFTGAQRARPGRFELADQGTLFLDEIDSLPLHLQAKLLAAIQDSGTTRLGDHRFRPSSFRLITASQTNLRDMVAAKQFRADLMHRVSVIEIELPPVRSLGSELVTAFEAAVSMERTRLGQTALPIEPAVYMALLSHDWPGNFRELAAAAQRYSIGLPPLPSVEVWSPVNGLRDQMSRFERVLVSRALSMHNGDLRAASKALSLPLETLRYRMRLLGLHGISKKPAASRQTRDSRPPSRTTSEPAPVA